MLSFLFVDKESFWFQIVLRAFNDIIFTPERKMLSVLKLIQGSEVFEDFSGTFLTLNGQENYVFKRKFMYV